MINKKVLILGNFWPHVRGGHRVSPLLRNLSNYGYYPTILTLWPKDKPKLEINHKKKFKIIYVDELSFEEQFKLAFSRLKILNFLKKNIKTTPTNNLFNMEESNSGFKRSFLNKLKGMVSSFFFMPDEYNISFFRIKHQAKKYIDNNKVDIILSEFPVTFHLVGSNLSKKYNIPWIADFVDPWSDNFNYSYGPFRKKIDRFIQKNSLKNAYGVVTVSPVWQEKNSAYNKRSFCIEHSFKDKLSPKRSILRSINILYAGRIYPEIQDHKLFFQLLNNYLKQSPELKNLLNVTFVGEGANESLKRISESMGLSDCIKIGSRVSQNQLTKLKQDSDILMMFSTNSETDGWYTSKLFDYIGSIRPILVLGHNSNNIIADFVVKNNIGYFVSDNKSFSAFFDDLIKRVKNSEGLDYSVKESFVDNYHESEMTKRFADLFDRALESYE